MEVHNLSSEQSDGPVVLAGYGYGLPISRLYARYFGGDLQIISMEGWVAFFTSFDAVCVAAHAALHVPCGAAARCCHSSRMHAQLHMAVHATSAQSRVPHLHAIACHWVCRLLGHAIRLSFGPVAEVSLLPRAAAAHSLSGDCGWELQSCNVLADSQS